MIELHICYLPCGKSVQGKKTVPRVLSTARSAFFLTKAVWQGSLDRLLSKTACINMYVFCYWRVLLLFFSFVYWGTCNQHT